MDQVLKHSSAALIQPVKNNGGRPAYTSQLAIGNWQPRIRNQTGSSAVHVEARPNTHTAAQHARRSAARTIQQSDYRTFIHLALSSTIL